MEKNWQITPITIEGKKRIEIRFPYHQGSIREIKSWKGAVWDASLHCWHVTDNAYFRELLGLAIPMKDYIGKGLADKMAIGGIEKIKEFTRFLRSKNYSEQTVKTYTEAIGIFLSYFPTKKVEEIGNTDVIDFNNDYIKAKKYSLSFQNQVVNALKLFYQSIQDARIDLDKVHRPRKVRVLPNVLSKEEVKLLLGSLMNTKHRAMLSLIYSCGLRCGELLNIQIGDIASDRNLLLIKQAKGFKDRIAPLSNKTIQLLREYYQAYRPKKFLFEGQYPNTPYDARSLQQVMKKALQKAGIKKPATLHWLGHSYATHLLEAGTDLRYIQEILGHKSSRTTEIYTHVSTRSIQNINTPFDDL